MNTIPSKNLIVAIIILILTIIGILIWNNYQIQFIPKTENPINPPSLFSNECGIENCHGLDITCGKPAEICNAMYQLGDKCRQFAQCGKVDGQCQQIENPQFIACKTCVQNCEQKYKNNPDSSNVFMCESECGE